MEPIIIRIWPLIQWSSVTFLAAAKFSDVNTIIFDNVALNVHLCSYVCIAFMKNASQVLPISSILIFLVQKWFHVCWFDQDTKQLEIYG